MNQTPARSSGSETPKTPGWSLGLFGSGWGMSAVKKEKPQGKAIEQPPTAPINSLSPRAMARTVNNLDLGGARSSQQIPDHTFANASAKRPPQAMGQSETAAVSRTSASPWVPQSGKGGRESTSGVSFASATKKTWLPPGIQARKSRARTKYRPRSATLNKTMKQIPPLKVDDFRNAILRPADKGPSSHASLAKVQVLRSGRTLNESHARLLEGTQQQRKRKTTFAIEAESVSDLVSPGTEGPRNKRVKFQKPQSTPHPNGMHSPQSAASSQNSSILSVQLEQQSLRPSLDQPYHCILEAGEPEFGVDQSLRSPEPHSLIPFVVPPPQHRENDSELTTEEIPEEEILDKKATDDSENEGHQSKKSRKSPDKDAEKPAPWKCESCGTENDDEETFCTGCRKTRKTVNASGWGDVFSRFKKGWKCNVCLVNNEEAVTKCLSCETPRDGAANAASSESAKTPAAKDGAFTFSAAGAKPAEKTPPGKASTSGGFPGVGGSGAASTTSSQHSATGGFTFGAPSAGIPSAPSTAGGFTFGAPSAGIASAPTPALAAEKDGEKAQAAPVQGFKFGGMSKESKEEEKAEAAPKKGGFGFDSNPSAADKKDEGQKQPFTFGAPTSANGNDTAPKSTFKFGASGTADKNASTANPSAAATPALASNAATSAAPPGPSSGFALATPLNEDAKAMKPSGSIGFGATNGGSTSGAAGPQSSAKEAPKNGDSVGFGAPLGFAPPPAPGPETSESGGNTKKRRPDTTAGAKDEADLTQPQSSKKTFQFGASANGTSAPPTSIPAASSGGGPTFTFGASSNQPPATEAKSAAPMPNFGATSTQTPAPATSFGSQGQAAPFQFGSKPATAAAPAAPTFGQSAPTNGPNGTSTGPTFGQPASATSAPAFGQSSTTGGTPAFSFGASNGTAPQSTGANSFGANVTQPPKTSSGAATFGFGAAEGSGGFSGSSNTANLTAPSSFGGAAPSSGGFGGTPGLGGAAAPSTAAFGAPPTPAGPSFGAAAQPASGFGAATPSAPTAFGGTPAPGFGAPQFGGATQAPSSMGQASGFGGTSAASFGAPGGDAGGGGGFNMGTGGAASRRGRRIVKARRPR